PLPADRWWWAARPAGLRRRRRGVRPGSALAWRRAAARARQVEPRAARDQEQEAAEGLEVEAGAPDGAGILEVVAVGPGAGGVGKVADQRDEQRDDADGEDGGHRRAASAPSRSVGHDHGR